MKTKNFIATAIFVLSTLLSLNYSPIYAKSDLALKAKDIKTIDSDLDGVTDDRDKCPDTPLGVVVNADGCPVVPPSGLIEASFDSDADGILDEYDCCPYTPAGVAVDGIGCPLQI